MGNPLSSFWLIEEADLDNCGKYDLFVVYI